jgi:hypothetical protein
MAKQKTASAEKPIELLNLDMALSPFEAPSSPIGEALVKTLQATLSLDTASDDDLMQEDTVQKHRLLYVVSLLRLLGVLRSGAVHPVDQAKLALGYIRHAESQGLAALQFGRSVADDKLAEEVRVLRERLAETAERKAKAIVENG